MLKVRTLPVGAIATNCYLVFDDVSQSLCIIDPGAEGKLIAAAAREFAPRKMQILLTHAHVDHISGIGELVKELPGTPVWVHPGDLELYLSPDNALEPYLPAAQGLPDPEAKTPEFPGMKILHLPGHTPGGVGYYFAAEKMLFSGDTLFDGSVGRTDLPGGDWDTLKNAIKQTLFALPEDVRVFCGHGPSTTVGKEKHGNPYL